MTTMILATLGVSSAWGEEIDTVTAPDVPLGSAKCEDETYIQSCVQSYVNAGMCYLRLPNLDNFDMDEILAHFPEDCYDCPNIAPLAEAECGDLGISQDTLKQMEALNTAMEGFGGEDTLASDVEGRRRAGSGKITVDDDTSDIEEKLKNLTPEETSTLNKFKSLIDDVMNGDPFAPEFCWRDSHTRDVGEIGSECPYGQERVGLIGFWCYDLCPGGWSRARDSSGRALNAECIQNCPSGWTDIGVACTIEGHIGHNYAREGFPWKFGDWVGSDSGMIKRCESKYGEGNCEKQGWMFYPKCNTGEEQLMRGLKWVGVTNWCRPTVDCASIGMLAGFQITGRTCSKQAPKLWPGIRHTDCPAGTERSGALCYGKCRSGYEGVGPVCWGQSPEGWVECGMGSARDDGTCMMVVSGQVMGPITLAATIATFGSSSAATTAAQSPWIVEQAMELLEMIKEATPITRELISIFFTFMNVNTAVSHKMFETEEDIVRFIAKVSRIFDSSGVSSTVAAFSYPKCEKYFPRRRPELERLAHLQNENAEAQLEI